MARLARGARRRRGLTAAGEDQGAHYRQGYKGFAGRKKPRLAPDGDPSGMVALKAEFLEWMCVRNSSTATLKSYDVSLEHFLVWCAERGLTRPSEVSLAILERYQRWLYHYRQPSGRPLAFRSQQSKLTCVRGFFRFLARTRRVLSNPASELLLPKAPVRLPRDVLTAEEAERVLAMPNVGDALGLRDRAILETLYSTGIRRSELLKLSLHDVDRSRSLLMVREGKGGRDRVVPIGERGLFWIERYLAEVRPLLAVEPDPQNVFLNLCGEPLGAETLSILAKKYVRSSGVGKSGACHLFRHTMATLMLEGGADIRFIQEMLGHRRLDTTQIYTRVSPQKLKAIHAATHPGAKLQRERPRRVEEPGGTGREGEELLASLEAEAAEDTDD